ncbi:MAG: hypothetical protein RL412_1444 [Pseudomonadota bacterium]|jgi:uncharacterized membrane protein YgdD (TMEM256/DUF423 family)
MKNDSTTNLTIAGVLIAMATALGAFGTHALKPLLPPARFDSFEIGVTYQLFHALGLMGIALLQRSHPESVGLRWSARLILVGLLLFSGSIYALTFGAPRFLGMVAPVGGTSLIVAWAIFAASCLRLRLPSATP